MTCVGMGKEVGCTLNQNKLMYQGLLLAPEVVCSAVKTAIFTGKIMTMLGFECLPAQGTKRGDIITTVLMKNSENLVAFCQGIQKGSPIDIRSLCSGRTYIPRGKTWRSYSHSGNV